MDAQLVATVLGVVGTLVGVGLGYGLQERSARRARIFDSVHRALELGREFQQDVLDFGITFVTLGDLPSPGPDDDPEEARQFGLDYQFRLLNEAETRLRQTEREILRVGVDLALYTDLYRSSDERVTGFEVIADELCGPGVRRSISEARAESDIHDLVFRIGVIVALFESEASRYLHKRHRWRGRTLQSVAMGAPQGLGEDNGSDTAAHGSQPEPPPDTDRP
ncbi:hypothetical protein ABZY81_43740 [Streptomyces sp. NPDC006514]|uniref:hypothetical protein n=1 Tax=Streptomyces sp. NPDC006514 TaxID=3154308 RepID=UPI00339F6C20